MGSWTNTATPPPAFSNELMNAQRIKDCRNGQARRAFTLIEMIGTLTVIALLATLLVPMLIRQMDKIAGDQESAALKSFGDALQQSILRNRYITNATDWATQTATEL